MISKGAFLDQRPSGSTSDLFFELETGITDPLKCAVADEFHTGRKIGILYGLLLEEICAQIFLVVIWKHCGYDGV